MLNFNDFDKSDLPFDTYNQDFKIETYESKDKGDEKNKKKRERKLKKQKEQTKEILDENAQNTLKKEVRPVERTKLTTSNMNIRELEELTEQNIRQFKHRSRRNRAIIITLIVVLLIAITAVAVYARMIYLQNNCFLYTHGNVDAVYIVDGMEAKRFRTPAGLQGNRILRVDFDLSIEDSGNFEIRFRVDVYQSNELLENCFVYLPGDDFYDGRNGYYYTREPVSGNAQYDLCSGVILDNAYEDTLNTENFKLEFHTYISRV